MNAETLLVRAIMDRLAFEPDLILFRNNVGVRKRGAVRFGLQNHAHPTGSADLVGGLCGRLFALEVKMPGEELRDDQAKFLEAVNKNGGYGAVVHSVDAAVAAVRDARKQFKRRIVA